jgi:Flp pilus assembly protein TadG
MSEQPNTPNLVKRALNRVGATMRDLRDSRRGALGVAMALLAVPTVMVVGAAVDYARLEQFKTQLQATVDSAALSGAAAYVDSSSASNAQTVANNYLTSNIGLLPSHIGNVTTSAAAAQVTSGSNQGYTVTVTATATIGTTFMRMVTSTLNVSVSATAVNPIVQITISTSNFNSSAADLNTLWYWLINSSSPNAQPTTSNFTSSQKLACNHNCTNSSVTFSATATQMIGMALENVTGGISDYGCTQYQTAPGSWKWVQRNGRWTQQWVTSSCAGTTQWFFSNMMPPSNNTYNSSSIDTGYTSVTQNCSLQVALSTSLPSTTTPPLSSQCFSSMPSYAYPSCAQLSGQYATFYWNDMGGTGDDHDYNDAEISVKCSAGSGNTATGVYLSS